MSITPQIVGWYISILKTTNKTETIENLLPNYLTQRGIYHTDKKNLLTDEEHEKLRNLTADGDAVKLNDGVLVYAVSTQAYNSAPCHSCCFKTTCLSKKRRKVYEPTIVYAYLLAQQKT